MERAEAAMKGGKPEEAMRLLRDAQRYADLVQRDVGEGTDGTSPGVGVPGDATADGGGSGADETDATDGAVRAAASGSGSGSAGLVDGSGPG